MDGTVPKLCETLGILYCVYHKYAITNQHIGHQQLLHNG